MAIAIIPAAGAGKRMGAKKPKQFIELLGSPIMLHTLKPFLTCSKIEKIILSISEDSSQAIKNCLARNPDKDNAHKIETVTGGKERQNSVYNALKAADLEQDDIVVIHDCVRPFVTESMIEQCIDAAGENSAAIFAVPASDTVKGVADGFISSTIPREGVQLAQTPQAFKYGLIMNAHEQAASKGLICTDDAHIAELYGCSVKILPGSKINIKITTREDLLFARSILENKVEYYCS